MSHYNQPFVKRKFIEFIVWPIQGLILFFLVGLMRLLPVWMTSALFGRLATLIGPHSQYHKRAKAHLGHAMPALSDKEKDDILRGMWAHLGRLAGEYPHIHLMGTDTYMTIHGLDKLEAETGGGFLVGAHLGNWELNLMLTAMLGRHYGAVYRKLNNPFSNWVLDMRHKRGNPDTFAKGQGAARGMMQTLRKNGFIHIIADQKYREGIKAPFFGHPADTPVGHIKIALKHKVPIFYIHVIRRHNCHYDAYISDAQYLYTDGKVTDELLLQHATQMNDTLAHLISKHPEQWLWPHRRWGKSL